MTESREPMERDALREALARNLRVHTLKDGTIAPSLIAEGPQFRYATPEEFAKVLLDDDTLAAIPEDEDRGLRAAPIEVICPSCDGVGEKVTGYYEPESDTCWTCDGKGRFLAQPALGAQPRPEAGERTDG